MDGTIVERLRALLAGSTRTQSMKDLRRRGVTQIPVLGRDQLASLVEEAVAATLRDRGLLDDRGEVAAEAMERAKGLLREVGRLEAEREASRRAGAEIERRGDELRREVFLAESRLREARARAREDGAGAPLTVRGRVRELFATHASSPGERSTRSPPSSRRSSPRRSPAPSPARARRAPARSRRSTARSGGCAAPSRRRRRTSRCGGSP